jgi:hypothetical protein
MSRDKKTATCDSTAKSLKYDLVSIKPSTSAPKKKMAVFVNDCGRTKTVHFGAHGMSDFTKHKDVDRKLRYIARHDNGRENWNDPMSAGALSRWILWNKPSYRDSVLDYKKRFKFT